MNRDGFAEWHHDDFSGIVLHLDPMAEIDFTFGFDIRRHEIAGIVNGVRLGGSKIGEVSSYQVGGLNVVEQMESESGHRPAPREVAGANALAVAVMPTQRQRLLRSESVRNLFRFY